MKNSLFILVILWSCFSYAQSLKGKVLDAKTQEPIESAAIYFDNTTIGTSTNDKGEFEIEFNQNIKSPLIISFLGYQKMTLYEYSSETFYNILLEEQNDVLDEVVIVADDGMSRALKLKYFRSQFLGNSKNAKSCKILNESDLILRYNKSTKELTASSKSPLLIKNEKLGYEIQYEIKDFILGFSYVNQDTNSYVVKSLFYAGTSFYQSLDDGNKTIKRRNKAYKGSVLHFMRALANESLEDEDYLIFSKRFKVDWEDYISVTSIPSSESVEVELKLPFTVVYKKNHQTVVLSDKELRRMRLAHGQEPETTDENLTKKIVTKIIIDSYGNYSPIEAVNLIGYMSKFRIGDTLPLDYEFTEERR